MKKYFYFTTIFFLFSLVILGYQNYTRIYLYSPDKNQTVTIYRPFFELKTNYYILPYRYNGIFVPTDNYIYFTPGVETLSSVESRFQIQWSDPIVFKMEKGKYISHTKNKIIKFDGENGLIISYLANSNYIINSLIILFILFINLINIILFFVFMVAKILIIIGKHLP